MKRFKNILFFVDGRDNPTPSLLRALNLAKSNGARLTLIDVVEPVETPKDIESNYKIDLTEVLKKERWQILKDLIAGLDQKDSIIYSKVLVGIPFIEAIKYVQNGAYDLLIKVARPPSNFSERLFGGNDMHLLRKCPCPVLIDRPSTEEHYQQVLATVELEPTNDKSCDELVMQLATSLAQREEADVNIVHAWRLQGESTFRSGRYRIDDSELESMLVSEEALHRDRLEQLLKGFDIQINDDQVNIAKGDTVATINRVAKNIDADIIVMGTVGRVGIPGLFIGNTAEEVLQTTKCSVLAVKPEGFISPVA